VPEIKEQWVHTGTYFMGSNHWRRQGVHQGAGAWCPQVATFFHQLENCACGSPRTTFAAAGRVFSALKASKMHLRLGLRLNPAGERTALPQTSRMVGRGSLPLGASVVHPQDKFRATTLAITCRCIT